MGWFDSAETGDSVRPISKERIEKIFDGQGWYYGRDDDDDVCGRWDGAPFFFLFMGQDHEILQVTARVAEEVPAEREDELASVIEDWHRDRIWPKAFYAPSEAGPLRIMTEVNVDYEHGATDAQLLQHVNCAIATSLSLFDHIRETLGIPKESDED